MKFSLSRVTPIVSQPLVSNSCMIDFPEVIALLHAAICPQDGDVKLPYPEAWFDYITPLDMGRVSGNVLVKGNSASFGGGISISAGTVTLRGSTVSGNTANSDKTASPSNEDPNTYGNFLAAEVLRIRQQQLWFRGWDDTAIEAATCTSITVCHHGIYTPSAPEAAHAMAIDIINHSTGLLDMAALRPSRQVRRRLLRSRSAWSPCGT